MHSTVTANATFFLVNVANLSQEQGLPMGLIAPDTFVLPTLGPKLSQLKQRLYNGLGFFVLRGLEPGKYNPRMNMLIYAGIASYIGEKRAIQYEGGPALSQSTHHQCLPHICMRIGLTTSVR